MGMLATSIVMRTFTNTPLEKMLKQIWIYTMELEEAIDGNQTYTGCYKLDG
jgi:hypothetical protein